jgi:hypothetical protein
MQRYSVSPAVLTAALSACAVEPELLNSERIEERFGNYGVEILERTAHEPAARTRSSISPNPARLPSRTNTRK